jgi:hypothetical protein
MKIKTKTPSEKAIQSMYSAFIQLKEEMEKLNSYLITTKKIIQKEYGYDKDKNYDFIAFNKSDEINAKDVRDVIDITLSLDAAKQGKHLIALKMSNTLLGLELIAPTVERLNELYSSDIEKGKSKEEMTDIYEERYNLWEYYKFNFGEITMDNPTFGYKEDEIIMAKELNNERKHIEKILYIVAKYSNTKRIENKNSNNL